MRTNDVHIQETDRVVEIRDNINELKFKVFLETVESIDEENGDSMITYDVYVMSAEGFEVYPVVSYDNIEDAVKDFERNVRNYTLVVKSQSKPIDTIEFFREKINYQKIDPDCCLNCEFCNREWGKCRQNHHNHDKHPDLVCENPENFTFFKDLIHPAKYQEFYHEDFDYGFHPHMSGPGFHSLEVRPKVDFNGICKNYKRKSCGKKRPPQPKPPQNINITATQDFQPYLTTR